MKPITLALTLVFLAMTASAAPTLRPHTYAIKQVEKGSRRELALKRALKIVPFTDASEWVIHPVWAARERSPIGVTRFSADGKPELYLVSDWLPKGSIPRGSVGQVHSVADLGGTSVAAAVGWTDTDAAVHNAVLFLDRVEGKYHLRARVDLAGVGDVVRGPEKTAIVATASANRAGGGPRLTVVGARGIIGELLPADERGDARESVRGLPQVSLQHVAGSEYVLHDPADQTVYRFRVSLVDDRVALSSVQKFSTNDDPTISNARVVGLLASPGGGTLVARVALRANGPRTVVTKFSNDGGVEGTWESDNPWNTVLRRAEGLDGIVSRGGVHVESVRFGQPD